LAEEKGLTIRMMSPTGKASQVLTAKTGFPAETIHRSLKMQKGEDFPRESIREDVIIIDEVSMVGIDTMFAITHALEENTWCHVIFVGDCNQLPSVSPGNFLSDMMQSGVVNVVSLTKIHRQDENSYIAVLANDVAKGKIVNVPDNATDIKWHDLNGQEDFEITIRRLVKEFINGNSIDDLQIISPMYKGNFGVNKINEVVQGLMAKENETDKEPFKRGFVTFYVGDRVIQLENNYEKKIFNGDIGTVVEAGRKVTNPEISDAEKDFVVVKFYGENLTYLEEEIDQLRLAWCITIHKFEGSQAPYIVFLFSRESSNMISKELLYTGMSRAEKRLDIYGHLDVFRIAPTKSAIRKRYSNTVNIIKELKENRTILQVLELKNK
jgi:exodeoxyribonuclease V alpha subunit